MAKVYGHLITAYYREYHDLYACSGIMYKHESPRRNPEFVTRKVTRGAAKIKLGLSKELRLGNMDARRDWEYAGDYVEAMWLMPQQPKPDDYFVATGETYSVRGLCRLSFRHVGLDYRDFVVEEAERLRPLETVQLVGSPSKARNNSGWQAKVPFEELVAMMAEADLEISRRDMEEGEDP